MSVRTLPARGELLDFGGTLTVETCPACGVTHAVPTTLIEKAHADHSRSIYCPNGHTWHYTGETDAEREKRQRKWAEDRATRLQAELDRTEASRRAWKGQTTKLRNRAAEGLCPFCGKFLADLGVHVAKRHPGETPRELTEDDATAPLEAAVDVAKDPARVRTGARGGKARAERLSPERRSEIARAAAAARWHR